MQQENKDREAGPDALELADLIDASALQKLMEDFFAVARLPVGIIDAKGRVLVSVGWQEVCTGFHRVHPQTCRHCIESDTELSAGLAPGDFRLYKCKNGLWDMATPIVIAGRQLGNIFTGQFFFEGESVDREFFRAQARRYGFDEESYLSALDRVPRVKRETVDRGMSFFLKLADTLSQLGYSNIQLARLLAERKRAEEALRQRAEEIGRLLEVVPAAVWVSEDPQCATITGNQRANEFYEALPGENVSAGTRPDVRRFFSADGRELTAAEMPMQLAAATNRDIRHFELHEQTPSRRTIAMLGNAVPLRDDRGHVRGCIGAFLDITDRKRAEEELRKANEELVRTAEELARSNRDLELFAYAASHDLQEPLRMVDGFLKLLESRYGTQLDDKAREYIGHAIEGANRMSKLINDLLEYSRVGRKGRQLKPTHAGKALVGALANLRTAIEETGSVVTSEELPVIMGDSGQLVQLFQNLIANAIKFRSTDRVPEIHVGACRRDGYWELYVRDNGIGIDPEHQERIFQIFQRLHSRSKYPGTGIGLAICKRIVERHGGRIWVESKVNAGSTFAFSLNPAS